MAHHNILFDLFDIRVPIEHHPPEISDGPDAIMLHDLLGSYRPVCGFRAELHATRYLARTARDV